MLIGKVNICGIQVFPTLVGSAYFFIKTKNPNSTDLQYKVSKIKICETLQKLVTYSHHFHCHQLVTSLFESFDDICDQTSSNTIRFDHDECSLFVGEIFRWRLQVGKEEEFLLNNVQVYHHE